MTNINFLLTDHEYQQIITLLGATLWNLCEVYVKTMWNSVQFSQDFHMVFTGFSHNYSHRISQECEKPCENSMWNGSTLSQGISQHSVWNTMWKYMWNIIIISYEDDYLFLWKRMWKYELCEIPCEKKDVRRNNVKYHVKKSVKLKLQGQKCMAFNSPPLYLASNLKSPVNWNIDHVKKYFHVYIYPSKFQLLWPRTLAYFIAIMSIM